MAFDGKSQRGRRRRQSARATQAMASRSAPRQARPEGRGGEVEPDRRSRGKSRRRLSSAYRPRAEASEASKALSSKTLSSTPPDSVLRSSQRRSWASARSTLNRPEFSASAPPTRRLRSPHQRHLRLVPESHADSRASGSTSLRTPKASSSMRSGASYTGRRSAPERFPHRASSRGERVAATPARRGRRQPPTRVRKAVSPLVYVLRLLIVGVGLGVIAGTVLSSIDPGLRYSANQADSTEAEAVAAATQPKGLRLGQEMTGLKTQIELMIAAQKGLTVGVFIVDLDTQSYLDINARRQFPSASTIKLPILVALFEEVDQGNISLNEKLTMTEELIAPEAGEMQFLPVGTQFSVLDTATEMIRISDNTATNLLIERLGGAASLNQRFQSWGLRETQIQNLLPDLEGSNTISPNDLVTLMGRINQGEIVEMRSRDRIFDILQTTQTNELLPQGIGSEARIAHKTGNIGQVIGDVGLVDMPSGKRYIIMAIVERPHGDPRAEELIRSISAGTYQFFEAGGSTSEQMTPTVPRSNIADQEPLRAPSIMTTDP